MSSPERILDLKFGPNNNLTGVSINPYYLEKEDLGEILRGQIFAEGRRDISIRKENQTIGISAKKLQDARALSPEERELFIKESADSMYWAIEIIITGESLNNSTSNNSKPSSFPSHGFNRRLLQPKVNIDIAKSPNFNLIPSSEGTEKPMGAYLNPKFFSNDALKEILEREIFNSGSKRRIEMFSGNHQNIVFNPEELEEYASLPEEKRNEIIGYMLNMIRDSWIITIRESPKT